MVLSVMSADPSNANTSLSGGNGTGSPKTAPSVGMHHKKTNSLVGFDPLLGDGIAGAAGGGSGSSPKQQQHAPVGTGSMGGIGADDILAALYGPPSSPGGAGADAGLNTSMNSKSSSSRHSRVRSFGGFGSGSRTPPRTPIKLQPKLNNNSLQKSPKTAPAANSKNNNGSQQQVSPKELAQNLRELANAIDRTSLTPPPPGPPLSDSGKNTASKSGGAATATPTSTPGRMKIKLPWKKKKKDQPATKMMMPAANAPAPSAVAPPPDFDSIGNDAQKQASTRPARAKCQSVDFAAESYDWIYTLAAADGAGNSNGNGSNGLAKPSSAAALGSAATATTAVAGMAVPSSASGTLTSPMIQELYYSSTDAAMNDLSLPSLSKPRATSFLTGKETNFRTTEQDATDFQVQIPPRADVEACSRLCQFIDTYRDEGRGFDLNDLVGIPSLELSRFAKGDASAVDLKGVKDCFRPVVENLLECAPDDFVGVKAHCMTGDSRKGDDPGSRREFLIIERQRQLLVCFRGTKSEQQQGKYTGSGSAANKQQAQQLGEPVKLQENDGAEVFGDKVAALKEDDLELLTFRKLDELAEESPFLDIAFTGYSYGAALASLAAYRYAFGRQDIRVQAVVFGSPKVGLESLRLSAHSLPNFKMIRVEMENTRLPYLGTAGCHIGHTIRVGASPPPPPSSSTSKTPSEVSPKKSGDEMAAASAAAPLPPSNESKPVKAYKFDDCEPASVSVAGKNVVSSAVRSLSLFKRDQGLREYIDALEGIPKGVWVDDYDNLVGAGVRGKDNEARQML